MSKRIQPFVTALKFVVYEMVSSDIKKKDTETIESVSFLVDVVKQESCRRHPIWRNKFQICLNLQVLL